MSKSVTLPQTTIQLIKFPPRSTEFPRQVVDDAYGLSQAIGRLMLFSSPKIPVNIRNSMKVALRAFFNTHVTDTTDVFLANYREELRKKMDQNDELSRLNLILQEAFHDILNNDEVFPMPTDSVVKTIRVNSGDAGTLNNIVAFMQDTMRYTNVNSNKFSSSHFEDLKNELLEVLAAADDLEAGGRSDDEMLQVYNQTESGSLIDRSSKPGTLVTALLNNSEATREVVNQVAAIMPECFDYLNYLMAIAEERAGEIVTDNQNRGMPSILNQQRNNHLMIYAFGIMVLYFEKNIVEHLIINETNMEEFWARLSELRKVTAKGSGQKLDRVQAVFSDRWSSIAAGMMGANVSLTTSPGNLTLTRICQASGITGPASNMIGLRSVRLTAEMTHLLAVLWDAQEIVDRGKREDYKMNVASLFHHMLMSSVTMYGFTIKLQGNAADVKILAEGTGEVETSDDYFDDDNRGDGDNGDEGSDDSKGRYSTGQPLDYESAIQNIKVFYGDSDGDEQEYEEEEVEGETEGEPDMEISESSPNRYKRVTVDEISDGDLRKQYMLKVDHILNSKTIWSNYPQFEKEYGNEIMEIPSSFQELMNSTLADINILTTKTDKLDDRLSKWISGTRPASIEGKTSPKASRSTRQKKLAHSDHKDSTTTQSDLDDRSIERAKALMEMSKHELHTDEKAGLSRGRKALIGKTGSGGLVTGKAQKKISE